MDDWAWTREDTLTMQLAIPLDLGIYNRHIYNDEMAISGSMFTFCAILNLFSWPVEFDRTHK